MAWPSDRRHHRYAGRPGHAGAGRVGAEIEFILETARDYLEKKPSRSDILSLFAGLRPLAAPTTEGRKTREISRRHKITVSASGLFTIVGGKWTTYRRMGEELVDRVEKTLGWPKRRSPTRTLPIHGHGGRGKIDPGDPFWFYGSDAEKIRRLDGCSLAPLGEGAATGSIVSVCEAQVVWAVRKEMARTVEDILSRRVRALLLDPGQCLAIARPVAEIMSRELGADPAWVERQVEAFTKVAEAYLPRG